MITIEIALADIIVDLEQRVDLNALSEESAILHITNAYQFLPLPLNINISNGIATILSAAEAKRNAKTRRLLDRAASEAIRGRYRQAVQLYQQYLEQAPADVDAQRNLGMSYLDMGEIGPAEKHIVEGEPPCDIYVRWKPLHEQSIGWNPDLNDGVRLNIRPFVTAGVLRHKFAIHWKRDRGKNPDGSERINDRHYSREQKEEARRQAQQTSGQSKMEV